MYFNIYFKILFVLFILELVIIDETVIRQYNKCNNIIDISRLLPETDKEGPRLINHKISSYTDYITQIIIINFFFAILWNVSIMRYIIFPYGLIIWGDLISKLLCAHLGKTLSEKVSEEVKHHVGGRRRRRRPTIRHA